MNEIISGIYSISNTVNNKLYIGSSNDIKRRWQEHKSKLNNNRHSNRYLQFSWNKYKKNNFKFAILEEIFDINLLARIEQLYIHKYNSYIHKNGYNIDGKTSRRIGYKHSKETREKMSKSAIGKKMSKEACNKMSKAKSGRKYTKETREKMSKSGKGRIVSKKTRKKISKIHKGKIISKETIKKIKNTMKLHPRSPMIFTDEIREKISKGKLGQKCSEKTKEKIRNTLTGRKRSKEAVEKTRIANTGRKHTEESKDKMCKSWIKRKLKKLEIEEKLEILV